MKNYNSEIETMDSGHAGRQQSCKIRVYTSSVPTQYKSLRFLLYRIIVLYLL